MSAALSLSGWQVYTPDDAMATMKRMQRQILRALKDPYVVHRANEIVSVVASRNYPAQITAIGEYVKLFLYFVDNPIGEQKIMPIAYMLHEIQDTGATYGACDDAADLCAALGMANGIPARITAYAFGVATPGVDPASVPFTHVIADLFDGQQWHMLDVTRPDDIHRMPHVLRTLTLELQ